MPIISRHMVGGEEKNVKRNNMKIIEWCGFEWSTQDGWDDYNPMNPNCYHDETAVEIKDDHLLLYTHRNPKYFPEPDDYVLIGVGNVHTTQKNTFGYGYYEISAKLPKGNHLWPAFWVWSYGETYAEIDFLEAYSEDSMYFNLPTIKDILKWRVSTWNPFKWWKVQTNMWWGAEKDRKTIRARNHYISFTNPSDRFIRYGCLWLKDVIEFYYDDVMVRRITNPKVLKNYHGIEMKVVLNNMITNEKMDSDRSVFDIEYFTYTRADDNQ